MLAKHRIGTLPNVYYIPDYITSTEERRLTDEIIASKTLWTQVNTSFTTKKSAQADCFSAHTLQHEDVPVDFILQMV